MPCSGATITASMPRHWKCSRVRHATFTMPSIFGKNVSVYSAIRMYLYAPGYSCQDVLQRTIAADVADIFDKSDVLQVVAGDGAAQDNRRQVAILRAAIGR